MRLKTNVNLTLDLPLVGQYTGKVIGTVHSVYYGNDFNHQQIIYKLETELGYCFVNSNINLEGGDIFYPNSKNEYYDVLKSFMATTFGIQTTDIDLEL